MLGVSRYLSLGEDLQERIREANVSLHRFEAKYYELVHPEVYNGCEQKRINSTLKMVDQLIADNQGNVKCALDFGAGTGNLTGKLLHMGYNVTAIDISKEMCNLLKKKYEPFLESERLVIINSPIEDVSFNECEFDVITCYSVLHHLPDYVDALQRLSGFLRKGGVMYLDHEMSPFYWKSESSTLANLMKAAFFHSNPLFNAVCFMLMGVNVPSFDYSLSDYWHKKEHPLNHQKIRCVFERENYEFFKRTDYHLRRAWFSNPIFYLYMYFCRPETSFWVAKK